MDAFRELLAYRMEKALENKDLSKSRSIEAELVA